MNWNYGENSGSRDLLTDFQDEMSRYFNGGYHATKSGRHPEMDVRLTSEGAVLYAEVPGVDSDAIEVLVEGTTLTLKGSRPVGELAEGETYGMRERWSGKFARAIELPFPIEAGKVEAACNNGVLKVTLPRAEADKPKKVVVK